MIRSLALAFLLAQAPEGPSAPAPTGRAELADAARAALAAKCIQCHGPALPNPKAAFGYVTDLDRLISANKYIVPGKPEESELWKEIDEGDMPPDTAKAGPLTQAEREAIRAWIASLDPPPASAPTAPKPPEMPSPPATPPDSPSPLARALLLLGRTHVLLIHFPIALTTVAAAAEAWSLIRRLPPPLAIARFCLWFAAIAALASAGLGWLHALDGFASPFSNPLSITSLHRWLGTGAGLLAPLAALLAERDARRARRSRPALVAILLLALLTGAAGHFGGLLTHGAHFLGP